MANTKITTNVIADDAVTSAKLDTNISVAGTLASTGVLTANAGVVVDNFTLDGTTLALSSGTMTLDSASQIVLDADGGLIQLKDGGTEFAQLKNSSTDLQIISIAQDKDIIFRGNDGGSYLNALTLDMSAAGAATFNSDVTATGIKGIESNNGDPVLGHFINANSGTGAEAAVYITNSSTISDGLFLETTGASFTTVSGFVQDGCVIGSGSGASGGLSIMTRAAADMRFYTNGHTNERMRIDSSGNVQIGTGTPAYLVGTSDIAQLSVNRVGTSGAITNASRSAAFINVNGADGGSSIEFNTAGANNTQPSERMRIDGAGNVAIAQTSTSNTYKLQVNGAMRLSGGSGYYYINTGADSGLWMESAHNLRFATNDTQRMKIHASGCIDLGANADRSLGTNITTTVTSGSAGSGFWMSTGNSSATSSKIISSTDGSVGDLLINQGSGVNGGSIRFSSCDSEKMRINSNGQVSIGSTDLSGGLLNMRATPSIPSIETRNSTSGATHFALFFRNSSGTEIGFIKISNTGTTYDTGSDYRLKENAQPIQNGLERLNQLNPVKFDWKEDGTSSEGFIAHEVQEIFPDAVSGEKDAETMQGMDYGRITPLLVKAMQEQQTVIDDLKSRIETLEG